MKSGSRFIFVSALGLGLFFSGSWATGFGVSAGWAAPACTYQPVPDSLSIGFTGYKTSQKVGVKGKFVSSKSSGKSAHSFKSLAKLLSSAHVETDLSSVDSGNPLRDQNLKAAFFGLMSEGAKAKGTLSDIQVNPDNSGQAVLKLEFNGKKGAVPVAFTMDGSGAFELKGTLDLLAFDGSSALQSLNKVCGDLHKGPDGVTKTWSEVQVWATAKINMNCGK